MAQNQSITEEITGLREENRRLRERLEDFQHLQRVLETVISTLQVDEVLRNIVEETSRICQADEGAIILFNPSGEGEAKTLIRQEVGTRTLLNHHLNSLLAGWVMHHRQPLLTADLAKTFGDHLPPRRYEGVGSALGVPLMIRGELIGCLNLIRYIGKSPLGEREQQLILLLTPTFAQFIRHARLHDELFAETHRLRHEVQEKYAVHGIIGRSAAMQEVFALLERVIPTQARVLIQGESGTGKELIARVIHYSGPRKKGPFVAVDCGAIPANLLEAELFGYVRGAFTGAQRDKKGLFEEAAGGTLFLDEIANMPLEIQSKLLRAIQEEEIRPLGSTKTRKIDVRIIAAGSADIKAKVEAGEFREDLYYRLNVISVHLPPLRERRNDIPLLAQHFLGKLCPRHGKSIKGFLPETMTYMETYDWPGNVRELENVVERMVVLADKRTEYLPPELLPPEIRPPIFASKTAAPFTVEEGDIRSKKDAYEKAMLLEALTRNRWNQSAAARELGCSERTIRYKMKKFGLRKPS